MTAKPTILLIEDNPGFRFIFREVLESRGCQVWEAEDGEEGLEAAQARQPNIILLDLMLPGMHGFDVLKRLRENPSTCDLPVVILSVLDEPKDRQKAFELGADDYVVKGSDLPDQIVKTVFGLLATP